MLTSLGTNPSDTVYTLQGRKHASNVAPAALYALLPETERPDRMLVFCTTQAEEKSLPHLMRALDGQPCPIDVVRVSEEGSTQAVHEFLATLAASVPDDVDLTVDVTQGFRHQAFLTYTGVLYLTALRNVHLRAAYYGMLTESPSPFIDIGPIVELPRWFHALRVLRDTGNAHLVAQLVAESGPEAAEVSRSLELVAEAHASGLPLELGYTAAQFLDRHEASLRELLRQRNLPLADTLVDILAEKLAEQRLTTTPLGDVWKERLELNKGELARQARIIDSYLDREDYPTAFGLMREWLVLWAMWRTNRVSDWLNHEDGREPTRKALNTLRRQQTDRDRAMRRRQASTVTLTPEQDWVATVWGHLVALRNPYAHHGLDKKVTLSTEIEVRRHTDAAIKAWKERLRNVPELPLELPYPEETRRR